MKKNQSTSRQPLRRMRHSDAATTLKIYFHSNMGQDKLIVQKLEEKYGNQYVSSKLNFSVITSIIVGKYYADENDVINAVSFKTLVGSSILSSPAMIN